MAERELVADRLRELELLDDLRGRPAPFDFAAGLAQDDPPRLLAVRAQSIGDRRTREPRQLAEPPDPQLGEFPAPLGGQDEEIERERLEEERALVVVDDDDLERRRHARGRERGEPAGRRADPRLELGADRTKRPPERRVEPARQPLEAVRLDEGAPRPGDSTAKPASSRRRSTCSHASSAAAGSCSTRTSSGHIASASESRIPARTPSASPPRCRDP